MSVIVVAGKFVKDALRQSIDAGAKSVIVITAGFKEVGAAGAAAEKELVEICRAAGVRMVGPNCLGVLNTDHAMNATFAPSVPPPGKISVISQSGALCVAILDWAAEQKLGLGKVISFGNKADLNEVDFIQALAADKETKVIAGYLESIKEGDKFLRIAEQAAGVKPVVILKVGITQAGAKAASSHTGSLAGADIAYGAAFRRAGRHSRGKFRGAVRLRDGVCHAAAAGRRARGHHHQRRRPRHHGGGRGGRPGFENGFAQPGQRGKTQSLHARLGGVRESD